MKKGALFMKHRVVIQSLFIIRPKNARIKQQHTNCLVMSTVYTIYKYNLYLKRKFHLM